MTGASMEGAGITGEEAWDKIEIREVSTDETQRPGLPGLRHLRRNQR